MKVELDKAWPMPASADTAWALLQDVEAVASCMPGARITERIDATHYKGTVAIKFGPASMSFRGEIEVLALDPATRTLRLVGKGTDSTGSSGASMDLTARVEAIGGTSSQLVGRSEVSMSGKAAAFGGRMMGSVADQVLKQFAGNFANRVQAMSDATPPATQLADVPHAATADGATNPAASSAATSAAHPATNSVAANAVPLNGPALVWAMFRDWLRSLFAAKRA